MNYELILRQFKPDQEKFFKYVVKLINNFLGIKKRNPSKASMIAEEILVSHFVMIDLLDDNNEVIHEIDQSLYLKQQYLIDSKFLTYDKIIILRDVYSELSEDYLLAILNGIAKRRIKSFDNNELVPRKMKKDSPAVKPYEKKVAAVFDGLEEAEKLIYENDDTLANCSRLYEALGLSLPLQDKHE